MILICGYPNVTTLHQDLPKEEAPVVNHGSSSVNPDYTLLATAGFSLYPMHDSLRLLDAHLIFEPLLSSLGVMPQQMITNTRGNFCILYLRYKNFAKVIGKLLYKTEGILHSQNLWKYIYFFQILVKRSFKFQLSISKITKSLQILFKMTPNISEITLKFPLKIFT